MKVIGVSRQVADAFKSDPSGRLYAWQRTVDRHLAKIRQAAA